MIRLIAGLGNIGSEYERTRHNAGFWLIDRLADEYRAAMRTERGFHGELAKVQISGQPVWLLKPNTYMNRSGLAVAALARFYKIAPEAILVAHDELDLVPGDVRLKLGGRPGGNGALSVQNELGRADFWRLRIGIGHPGVKSEVSNWVLHKASPEHQALMDEAVARSAAVVPALVAGEMERGIMQLHTKPKKPASPASTNAVAVRNPVQNS
jgi:PTH1 family peptidyl-tRNA hydrolase